MKFRLIHPVVTSWDDNVIALEMDLEFAKHLKKYIVFYEKEFGVRDEFYDMAIKMMPIIKNAEVRALDN